jgi:predicted short-subunit dehydrogenase-like oxidoreductase (DUF2520 family)
VSQVISRTAAHARALAERLGAGWSDKAADVFPDADWVLVAVSDDAIGDVAAALAPFVPKALVTHTSGATPGAVLKPFFERYGVFYPLQSFSESHTPDWASVPFCVDASTENDLLLLEKTASEIGGKVYRVNDDQRAVLHLSAVFANNFANHCFAVAHNLLTQKGLPFELLHPLMRATLDKALAHPPAEVQTGPAIRGDHDTLERHLGLLTAHPLWQEIYRLMSESIVTPGSAWRREEE